MRFKFLLGPVAAVLCFASTDAFGSTSTEGHGPLPYQSAAEAEKAVRANPALEFSTNKLWDQFNEPGTGSYWMVFRADSPFYPAVVRRSAVGWMKFSNAVICEAPAQACETLVRLLSGEE